MSDSPAARLRPHLAVVREQLERFARVKREHVADLLAVLTAAMDAHEGRAQVAQERTAERSARIRQAIRAAAAYYAIERPGLTPRELVAMVRRYLANRLEEHRLQCAPSLRTIRDELFSSSKRSGTFGTETTRLPGYCASVAST